MNKKTKYATIQTLNESSDLASSRLSFSIVCKNDGTSHHYDLSQIGLQYPSIMRAFAWAIFRKRNSVGHWSRDQDIAAIKNFIAYLDGLYSSHRVLATIYDVDEQMLSNFAEWLKRYRSLSYITAAGRFKQIGSLCKSLIGLEGTNPNLRVPAVPFPNKHRMNNSVQGYSEAKFKEILKAVAQALRESSSRLERKYIPQWKDKPAPIDDIAEFNDDPKFNFRPSLWRSRKYQIWWWENNCNCQRLKSHEVQRIPLGGTFFKSFANGPESSTPHGSMKNLTAFYDEIGAGEFYVPQYLNAPCPIKYKSRWQKFEYVHWYWENVLKMEVMPDLQLRAKDLSFAGGLYYHGGVVAFYESIGIIHKLCIDDLIPYFVMLLSRTALNPSTIARMTIDCLVQDPTEPSRQMIEWTKFRASRGGRTIPVDSKNDTWAAAIIKRVIDITAPFRKPGQKQLWITSWGEGRTLSGREMTPQQFRNGIKYFVKKYQLYEESSDTDKQKALSLQPRKFRPTVAMMEYLRTEDLVYIQNLLGHKEARQTASYINRTGDPLLRMRRGLHQQAMLVGLTEGEDAKEALMGKLGIDSSKASKILVPGGEHDAMLNHCNDPKRSPFQGQSSGKTCTANENCCLSCQNLVVTPDDIVKYFCYVNYHEHLFRNGKISEIDLENLLSEKRVVWDTHILPKYQSEIIEKCRVHARSEPLPEWRLS